MTKRKIGMPDKLERAMRDALDASERRLMARLEKRMQVEADRAIREAWAQEVAVVARRLVSERINAGGLRERIVQRLSTMLTERVVAETLVDLVKRSDDRYGDQWWFIREIEDAVRQEIDGAAVVGPTGGDR